MINFLINFCFNFERSDPKPDLYLEFRAKRPRTPLRTRLVVAGVVTRGVAVGALRAGEGSGTTQRGYQVQRFRHEDARGTRAQLHALNVLRDGEVLFGVGTALLVLDADGEDGEVVDLHVLALQEQLLDAVHHVGEQTLDDALREGSVVARHVFREPCQVDGLLDHGEGKELAEHL